MAKHGPVTRAADWPMWVIEAQRPATSRLSTPSGSSMRYGRWLKPRTLGTSTNLNTMSPATWASTGQPFTPMVSSKLAQPSTSSSVNRYSPTMRRVSRMPTCGAISRMYEASKPGAYSRRNSKKSRAWRRPCSSPSLNCQASVPSIAVPSGLLSWVTLARHSTGFFCGRTMGVLRAKRRPSRVASSIRRPKCSQALPARAGSTLLTRNMVDGYSMPPWPSPFS